MTTLDEARSTDDEWAVPDEQGAEAEQAHADLAWAVEQSRRLARAYARMARIRASIEPQLDRLHAEEQRLEEWATTQEAPIARYVEYLEAALKEYALRRRARGGKKSLMLPWAEVETHVVGGGWTADDDAVGWALAVNPEWVRTTHRLLVSAVKRAPGFRVVGDQVVTPDGEVIPGVTVEPKQVEATVRVTGDAS